MFTDLQYKISSLQQHPHADSLEKMCQELRGMIHHGIALDIAYASVRHSAYRHCVQFLSTLVDALGGHVDQLGLLRLLEVTDHYVERPDVDVPGFFEAVLIEATCAYDQRHLIVDLGMGAAVVEHLGRVAHMGDVDGFQDLIEKIATLTQHCLWALDLKRVSWCVPHDPSEVIQFLVRIGLSEVVDVPEDVVKWLRLSQLVTGADGRLALTRRGYSMSAAYYACHYFEHPHLHRIHPCWQAAIVKYTSSDNLQRWFEQRVPMHPLAMSQCAERAHGDMFFEYISSMLREGATADVRMQAAEILASMPTPFHDRVLSAMKAARHDPVPKVRIMLDDLCSRVEG